MGAGVTVPEEGPLEAPCVQDRAWEKLGVEGNSKKLASLGVRWKSLRT